MLLLPIGLQILVRVGSEQLYTTTSPQIRWLQQGVVYSGVVVYRFCLKFQAKSIHHSLLYTSLVGVTTLVRRWWCIHVRFKRATIPHHLPTRVVAPRRGGIYRGSDVEILLEIPSNIYTPLLCIHHPLLESSLL
jgi:hypothetical protein